MSRSKVTRSLNAAALGASSPTLGYAGMPRTPTALEAPGSASVSTGGRGVLLSPVTILVVAALVRLMAWGAGLTSPAGFAGGDTDEYWALSDDVIASYTATEGTLYELALRRPPAYPAMLALLRAVGGGEAGAALLQSLFAIATIWLVVSVGRKLVGVREAAVAGWWLALDPLYAVESGILLTEVPFSLALLLASVAAWKAVQTGGLLWWAASGLALGAATLIRPISYYLPALLCPLVLVGLRSSGWRLSLASAAVLLAAFLAPVAPWLMRNDAYSGVATVSTIQGLNLAHYRAAGALNEGAGIELPDARQQIYALVDARLPADANPAARAKVQEQVALEVIRTEPLGYAISAAKGAGRTLVGPGRAHIGARTSGLPLAAAINAALLVLAVVSALVGSALAFAAFAIWSARRDWLRLALIATPVLYLLAVGSGLEAYSRFRLQMLPTLLLAAGCAAVSAYDWMRGRRQTHLTTA